MQYAQLLLLVHRICLTTQGRAIVYFDALGLKITVRFLFELLNTSKGNVNINVI